MKITKRWLEEQDACKEGLEWFEARKLKSIEHEELIKLLAKEGKIGWIWWLISHLLKGRSLVDFGCYCARLVLPIWEAENPEDNRLRHCLEIAENPESTSEELMDAASTAYWVASTDYWAAKGAANAAAKAAYWAANGAAYAAYWAAKAGM